MLYGACRRVAFGLGYRKLVTYTLPVESGASGKWKRSDSRLVYTPAMAKLKVELGRYQCRVNRVVDIFSFKIVSRTVIAGRPGETRQVRLWQGRLLNADCHTVDSTHEWEDDGAFSNQNGVAHPYDLVQLVATRPGSELNVR